MSNKWYGKTVAQYFINVMILSSRSEFLIHNISEPKTILLGNPKILIQNFQVNEKMIKM